jgi:hypothetical protein
MLKRFFDAIRDKDNCVDPLTSQMSHAKQRNEVATASLRRTLSAVFDRPDDEKTGVLKLTAIE